MLRLLPHPDAGPGKVEGFAVGLSLDADGRLWLRYHVDMPLDALVTGEPRAEIERADELWRSTCFEAFLRRPGEPGYAEFNFAPDYRWAAYRFDAYREGMENMVLDGAPEFGIDISDSHFALEVELTLPDGYRGVALDIALTAIVEEAGGTKSYWALAHPDGKPDFHHEACFALKLAPPLHR